MKLFAPEQESENPDEREGIEHRNQRQGSHDVAVAVERRHERDAEEVDHRGDDDEPRLAAELTAHRGAEEDTCRDDEHGGADEQRQEVEEQVFRQNLNVGAELVEHVGDNGDRVDREVERAEAAVAAEDVLNDMRINRERKTCADERGRDIEHQALDILFLDAENEVHKPRQTGAEDEVVLREDAEHDDGQEQEAVGDEHPVFLLVEPQREADEREHKEGQRGVHAQIDGRRDAGDAQGVPSDGEQGIEVAARDALTDLEEHQQRARHHREVDREREPLAEHLGEEGADRVHERVIERRMRRVDDLVLHHLRVVEAVLGIDREVLVHILGGVPAADVELLGGVREVVGEQLVLVIALLGEQEQRAHAETEQDDHREYHPRGGFAELHSHRPLHGEML